MLMRHNFWDVWDQAFNLFEQPTTARATAEERDEDFVLTAELPGLSDKDIQLTVEHDAVTVTAKRECAAPKEYKVHRLERATIDFTRTFSLPRHVDTEKVMAALKDGVLTITAPKAVSSKSRRIEVGVAQ